VRRCPECGALNPLSAWECIECGATLRSRAHVEITPPALIETSRLVIMSYRQAIKWAGTDETRLRLVARARGYKPGWAYHRLREARSA
jgi:hypothetical protein